MNRPNASPVMASLSPADLLDAELDLVNYAGEDKVISSDEMREKIKNLPPLKTFGTGIKTLDDIVGKMQEGEVIAIGGPRKHGKTLLAQTLTYHLARNEAHCLWFTFEVPVRQFLDQIPSNSLFYLPELNKKHDFKWFINRVIEAKTKYGIKFVFIDHLHELIDCFSGKQNLSLEIGMVMSDLKSLSIAHNLIIVLLVHSRKPEDAKGKPREVSDWDMRDSSFVPQTADTTWMVQREVLNENNQVTTIKVCVHRRTGALDKKLYLRKDGLLFVECDANGENITGRDMADESKRSLLYPKANPDAWIESNRD